MSILDIQEFYEVTLLDNQRWAESSKVADSTTPINLWELSSLQSTLTSDTPPSFSTSIEVRPTVHPRRHVFHCKLITPSLSEGMIISSAKSTALE